MHKWQKLNRTARPGLQPTGHHDGGCKPTLVSQGRF